MWKKFTDVPKFCSCFKSKLIVYFLVSKSYWSTTVPSRITHRNENKSSTKNDCRIHCILHQVTRLSCGICQKWTCKGKSPAHIIVYVTQEGFKTITQAHRDSMYHSIRLFSLSEIKQQTMSFTAEQDIIQIQIRTHGLFCWKKRNICVPNPLSCCKRTCG
jgi:hypothetical protein